MKDPTYITEVINANPVWEMAHVLSEVLNDNAPIDWGNYIPIAQTIIDRYEVKRK